MKTLVVVHAGILFYGLANEGDNTCDFVFGGAFLSI